jgi:hypothetical protein
MSIRDRNSRGKFYGARVLCVTWSLWIKLYPFKSNMFKIYLFIFEDSFLFQWRASLVHQCFKQHEVAQIVLDGRFSIYLFKSVKFEVALSLWYRASSFVNITY